MIEHAGQYDFERALLEKTRCDIYTFDWYVASRGSRCLKKIIM